MQRNHDWPEKLFACVAQARRRTFAWGEFDCALFMADCVMAMTGMDVADGWRGKCHDASSALVALARFHGKAGEPFEGTARRLFGAPLRSPLFAQRGDVVLVETGQGKAFAVVLGKVCVLPRADGAGLAEIPLRQASQAWRVP